VVIEVSPTSTLVYIPSSIFPFGINAITSSIYYLITPTFMPPFSITPPMPLAQFLVFI
jgi:hypothetical protein